MSSINSTAQAGATQDPGELFRNAANKNNVNEMLTLYRTHGKKPTSEFDIRAPGPLSGKTAAHRAALKGHASALRLLHSLGDTFEQKDKDGCTPEQLASDPKCKQVFALAALGRKAMAAAIGVFPQPFIMDQTMPMTSYMQFDRFRNARDTFAKVRAFSFINELKAALAKEESEAAERYDTGSAWVWLTPECMRVVNLIDNYYTLEGAQICRQKGGACGDRCDVAFTYLASIAKTGVLVEQIDVDEGGGKNHDFLVLNRREGEFTEKGLSEALIIDVLAGQTFFFENFNHIPHPLIKEGLSEKWSIPCSNKPISNPPPKWRPVKTLARVQKDIHPLARAGRPQT